MIDRPNLRAAVETLATRIDAAMAEYPDLLGWRMHPPAWSYWRDGGWRADRRGLLRAQATYLARAVTVAASRISEAYGIGAGSAWAERHFGAGGDERAAIASHTGARLVSAPAIDARLWVRCASCRDIDRGYGRAESAWIPVATWADATRAVRQWIESRDLGSGFWCGGEVRFSRRGPAIGSVSYNGRCWDVNGREIAQGGAS